VYGIQETCRDYLPQTIARYLSVPEPLRSIPDENNCSPQSMLLEQLSVVFRATTGYLEALAAHSRSAQAAQGHFLHERFNDRSTEITSTDNATLPMTASRRFIERIIDNTASPADIVAIAAQRLSHMLPQCTRIERGGLLGIGAIKAVHVTIPGGDGSAFRYTLAMSNGVVMTTCTQIVRNVPLKTISTRHDEWLTALHEELISYARQNADVRNFLQKFS
jgi:hypothetical protein